MKKLMLLFFLFCFHLFAYAQPPSFTQKLEGDYFLFDASVNETDEIFLLSWHLPDRYTISIIKYNPSQPLTGNLLELNMYPFIFLIDADNSRLKYIFKNSKDDLFIYFFGMHLFSADLNAFCRINTKTGQHWCRTGGIGQHSTITIDSLNQSHFFINTAGWGSSTIGLYYQKLSPSGALLKAKKLEFTGFDTYIDEKRVEPTDAIFLSKTQKIAFTGHLDRKNSFLLEADTAGQFYRKIAYKDIHLNQLLSVDEESFYAIGSTTLKTDLSGNQEDLVLLKLNADFEVVWAKVYFADNFDFYRAVIKVLPDGNLALAYSTDGAFPVILTKLDDQGNMKWQKGYPFFEPILNVFSDGSLLLCTREHFDAAGNTFQQILIAKTDTLGDIAGCEVFPTCLNSTDATIETSEFTINESLINPMSDSTELVFRDSVVRFADFCDIPPSPSPEFVLPDTVCVSACVEATGLNNHFAHGVAWELEGENLHEIRSDSLEFRQCFSQPGAYTVRQRVWFLGCVYEYEKTLTVLDDLRLSFDLEKEILCQPPPAQVKVQGNRPLSDVAWNTGAAGETIFPNTGGQYRATATDGYCQARDSFQIAFLNELISPDEALHIPDDTVVCEAHLPFALRPESSVATDFTLENQNGRQFDLREPGRYTVRAEVYGCPVEKPFELKTDRCDSKIYLPTAFSPNSDGINDDFAPQGKDFTTLELLIFDRWGGLIHRSEGVAAGWDGKTASGASAPLGVYSFKLTYLNTLLNKQEEVQGDVTVLR